MRNFRPLDSKLPPRFTPGIVLLLLLGATLIPLRAEIPAGLLFHASFDKLTTDADFARGDKSCSLDANLDLRAAEGIRGVGLLQKAGERCTYQLPGNLDTSQGSFSIWIKPLNWDGKIRKFRHFLTVTGTDDCTFLLYLYAVADQAVMHYINVYPKTSKKATWKAGAPVDILRRRQWVHLVSTWDKKNVRLYANGKCVGEGLVGSPIPKADKGQFTICPIQFWKNADWSDTEEQTICDEVRIFDHALSADEVLGLYASEIPGGLPDLKPKLTATLAPDYFANKLTVTLGTAHLDAAWKTRLLQHPRINLDVSDPHGQSLFSGEISLEKATQVIAIPQWVDGDYTARARLAVGAAKLESSTSIRKPPTPWLPRQTDWRANRVLEPWTALELHERKIKYWNGTVELDGAFPSQITTHGAPLLTAPIRLVSKSKAVWKTPRPSETKSHRITLAGEGTAGELTLSYETLMEFDGLVRVDLILTPPPTGMELPALDLEIPIRKEVARWYRNPRCADWEGEDLEEKHFLPYGWLGCEDRGLSWFMESDANWRVGENQPYTSLKADGESVVVRLHLISQPTRITKPLSYTVGFEPTPVRPLEANLYTHRWGGGPQIKGVNVFVYGWRHQISALNGMLIAHDPPHQRQLIDKWRGKGMETRSYTCLECTPNLSPEYRFFAEEWNQPYGSTFSGYERVPDKAPYSIVGVCPHSSFSAFHLWCVKEHLRNDWGGGIYTDIAGLKPCDNKRHGCGFTDAFGRTGRTYPLYALRAASRRIYQACRETGKRYYSHSHSNWYAPAHAFIDGWAPGEQYSTAVMKNPYYYMTEMPDRVWRSEFCSTTTGVSTFLLPQIGRLGSKEIRKQRGPAESCVIAALTYGVPIWSSLHQQVTEEVWAAQIAFGMEGVQFLPFWKQRKLLCTNPHIRVSLYQKEHRWLVVAANFTDTAQTGELRLANPDSQPTFHPAWLAGGLVPQGKTAKATIPGHSGMLFTLDVESTGQ